MGAKALQTLTLMHVYDRLKKEAIDIIRRFAYIWRHDNEA